MAIRAEYISVAFSDHLAHTVEIQLPDKFARMCCPRSKPMFKLREEVVNDSVFQERLKQAMVEWEDVRIEGLLNIKAALKQH